MDRQKIIKDAIPKKWKIFFQWYLVLLIFPVPWGLAIAFLIWKIIPVWADIIFWILPILSILALSYIIKEYFAKAFEEKLKEMNVDVSSFAQPQNQAEDDSKPKEMHHQSKDDDIPEAEEVE